MSRVLIGDQSDGLEFSDVVRDRNSGAPWSVEVRLVTPGLTAHQTVWSHYVDGFDELVTFFAGMADDWRGWEGERRYASLAGDLSLIGPHAGSRVSIDVTVAQTTIADGWRVAAGFTVDAGEQLRTAASDLTEIRE